jgi:hypothetical protein
VKLHPFFADEHLDWLALAAGSLPPPWEPTVVGSLDTSQFDNEFTSMPLHSPSDRVSGSLWEFLRVSESPRVCENF